MLQVIAIQEFPPVNAHGDAFGAIKSLRSFIETEWQDAVVRVGFVDLYAMFVAQSAALA